MVSRLFFPVRFGLVAALLASITATATGQGAFDKQVAGVLENYCLHCHEGAAAEGDVDLAPLVKHENSQPEEHAGLWVKIDHMLSSGQMPPAEESQPSANEKQIVGRWFYNNFVLRDGKEQVGVTRLRRLTRYEIENTLEDLLHIQLKPAYKPRTNEAVEPYGFVQRTLPEEIPGASGFVNDSQQLADAQFPLLRYVQCVDHALEQFVNSPSAVERVVGVEDTKEFDASLGEEVVQRFMRRAFRGVLPDDEYRQVMTQFRADPDSDAFTSLVAALRTILLSPRMLYRFEKVQGSQSPYRIQGSELAVRLSYFLWSSTPDQELLEWSQGDSVFKASEITAQVQRMLDSPRRIALSESLAAQWLEFEDILRQPTEDEIFRRSTYDEMLFGFDELVKSDRSILELVDADWMYLSPHNSSYKLQAAEPSSLEARFADVLKYRQVHAQGNDAYAPPVLHSISSDIYGGLITTTATLRLTSAPTRTSPIRRGVWILQNIIGDQIEAPQNVPPLDEILKQLEPGVEKPTKKQMVELHTEVDSCKACHAKIDPIGFGLENLSHVGTWRTKYPDKSPIESEGMLPGGQAFSNPKQLKQQLLDNYQDEIVENITRRFLAYALGRQLQPFDRPTVKRIVEKLAANDYRMSVLLTSVALSPQFLNRQDSP